MMYRRLFLTGAATAPIAVAAPSIAATDPAEAALLAVFRTLADEDKRAVHEIALVLTPEAHAGRAARQETRRATAGGPDGDAATNPECFGSDSGADS